MKRKKFTTRNKSKKNSKQLREYIKRKRAETGIYERRHFVKMTCNICKREDKIRVNKEHIHLYTKEIIDNYICLICSPPKRR